MITDMPYDAAFQPSPWVMGVVLIGIGPVLWWLAPDLARPRRGAGLWHRWNAHRTRTSGWERALQAVASPPGVVLVLVRFLALLSSAGGLALLVVTATG